MQESANKKIGSGSTLKVAAPGGSGSATLILNIHNYKIISNTSFEYLKHFRIRILSNQKLDPDPYKMMIYFY